MKRAILGPCPCQGCGEPLWWATVGGQDAAWRERRLVGRGLGIATYRLNRCGLPLRRAS